MRRPIFLLLLLALAGCVVPVSAQDTAEKRFSIHFGAALPLGDFGKDPFGSDPRAFEPDDPAILETGKFSAGNGFHVGFKTRFPLRGIDGLGATVGVDLIYQGMKKGFWRNRIEVYEGYHPYKPRYLNIPLFVGLNYTREVSPKLGLWIEGGAGPDLRKMTRYGYETVYYSRLWCYKVKTRTQVAFGYQAGAGVMLNDKYSIGVHYYGLGRSTIEGEKIETIGGIGYTEETDSSVEPFTTEKRSAQPMWLLRIGRHF